MIRYEFEKKLDFLAICRVVSKLSETMVIQYSDSAMEDGFNKDGSCVSDTGFMLVFNSPQTDGETVAKKVILKNHIISFGGFEPQEACDAYEELLCAIKNEAYFKYHGVV